MKYWIIVFIIIIAASCSKKNDPEITVADIKASIEYLVSDSLQGMKPGINGDLQTVKFINYEGEKKILNQTYNLLTEIANREKKLTFREAGTVQRTGGHGARYNVSLGIMPDFAGVEKRGLRVDAVTKGKPAEKGGILKGDIITAIDGKKVGNVYDYMNRLNTLESDRPISVDVLRGDKEVVLIIQL